MKKNRRNNSRPAAITTAKDTTKAIETRAGVLKEAEDVKKEAKTSFYLQISFGKEQITRTPAISRIFFSIDSSVTGMSFTRIFRIMLSYDLTLVLIPSIGFWS